MSVNRILNDAIVAGADPNQYVKAVNTKAKQALLKEFMDIIGPDEQYAVSYQGGGTKEFRDKIDRENELERSIRNQLRAELRTKAKELFNA